MANKLIITSSIVAFSTLLATPIIGNQIISEEIIKEKKILNDNGIEIAFDEANGYYESNRKFNGRIVDFLKFSKYIIEKNIKSEISKKRFFKYIEENKVDLNKKFNNTLFEGTLKVNNLGLEKIKSKITILDMPFLKDIKRTEENKSLFEIFENKKLNFNMIFSSKGKFEKISMQDLYVKNQVNNASIELKNILILEKHNNKYHSTIGKIEMITNDKHSDVDFLLKNYDLNLTYTDLLNNKITQNIDKIKLNLTDKQKYSKLKNISFNIENLSMYNKTYLINDKVNIENKYSFKNLKINDKFKSLIIPKFETSIDFKNLNKEALTKLFSQDPKNQKELEKNIKEIINKGFNLNLNAKLNSLEFGMTKIGKIIATSKNIIKPNNVSKINAAFLYLDSENELIIEKKDLKTYKQFLPIQNFIKNSVEKNENIIFKYNIKEGKEVK